VYKLNRCQRFTTSQLKRPTLGSKWRAKRIPKCALVWRTGHVQCTTGHSTVPVRCTRGLRAGLLSFGNSQSRRAIIHRIVRCTPDSVRCSKGTRLWNLAASGNQNCCSAIIHRTCPVYTGLSGVTAEQRLLRANGHLQRHLMRPRARRRQARPCWRTGHSTVHVRCATGHPGGPRSQNSNGRIATALVTWLAHRTCPVYAGLSGAPYDRQPPPTVMFGGWGYKYPNHPTIHCIQVFHFSTTYKSSSIQF
jgi:hypothetical protein